MAWIELHTILFKHRKLKIFARKLGIKFVHAVGHLTSLWCNVLELAEDGDITKWSKEDIAEYAGWEGDIGAFFNALINEDEGWLDEQNGRLLVHDWLDYAGRYLTTKYKNTNPNKLLYINMLYNRDNKDSLKTGFRLTTLPNLTLPNLTILTNTNTVYEFEKLWTKYPNKCGKKQALRHFQMSVKTDKDVLDIQQALENYLKSDRVKRGYIQNGSTWFNNWQDWIKNPEGKVLMEKKPCEALEKIKQWEREKGERLSKEIT